MSSLSEEDIQLIEELDFYLKSDTIKGNFYNVLKKYYSIINRLKIEVEELENKNRDLQIFVDDVKEGVYIDTPEFEETYINRNKIKEKLDRAKEVLDYMDNEKDRTIQIIIINYLQELWEGE